MTLGFRKYKGAVYNTIEDATWAKYFDDVGIKFDYTSEQFKYAQISLKPTFFLPDYDMYAKVCKKSSLGKELSPYKYLATLTQKKILLLKGVPNLRAYPLITPEGESSISLSHVNIINVGSKNHHAFITDEHLCGYQDYCCAGSNGIRAIKAINELHFKHPFVPDYLAFEDYIYDSLIEKKWACYFNKMGISFTQTIRSYLIDGDEFVWPSMFLAEFDTFVIVIRNSLNSLESHLSISLCKSLNKPVLVLEGQPELKYYTCFVPDGGDYGVKLTNVIPEDDKLITGAQLKGEVAFTKFAKLGDEAVKAINQINQGQF